jgi:hypothetical protein
MISSYSSNRNKVLLLLQQELVATVSGAPAVGERTSGLPLINQCPNLAAAEERADRALGEGHARRFPRRAEGQNHRRPARPGAFLTS